MKYVRFNMPLLRLDHKSEGKVLKDALSKAFCIPGQMIETLIAHRRKKDLYYIRFRCTGQQFSEFLILRAEYGASNMFAELRPELETGEYVVNNLVVDVTEGMMSIRIPQVVPSLDRVYHPMYPHIGERRDVEHNWIDGAGNAWTMNENYIYRNGTDIRHLSYETLWKEVIQKIGFAEPEDCGIRPVPSFSVSTPESRKACGAFTGHFHGGGKETILWGKVIDAVNRGENVLIQKNGGLISIKHEK